MAANDSSMRFEKGIKRVTILERDAAGHVTPTVLFEQPSTKQRQSRMLSPVEKFIRRAAEAGATGANAYILRHRRSNEKRRDGWLRDANTNVFRSAKKAGKDLKLKRWLMM